MVRANSSVERRDALSPELSELIDRASRYGTREEVAGRAVFRVALAAAGLFLTIISLTIGVSMARDAAPSGDINNDPGVLIALLPLLPFGVLFCSGAVLLALGVLHNPQPPTGDLYKLERIQDFGAIRRLIPLLDSASPEVRSVASATLSRMLRRMADSDAHRLDAEQRERLCLRLEIRRALSEFDLQMALLNLVERDKWSLAVPNLRRLAAAKWQNQYEQRVCKAAASALEAIVPTIEEASRILLRPSEFPIESLLRPLGHNSSIDPKSLLRPEDIARQAHGSMKPQG